MTWKSLSVPPVLIHSGSTIMRLYGRPCETFLLLRGSLSELERSIYESIASAAINRTVS